MDFTPNDFMCMYDGLDSTATAMCVHPTKEYEISSTVWWLRQVVNCNILVRPCNVQICVSVASVLDGKPGR